MKKTLIAVLFLTANITLFAQTTFFKWYPSNKYEYITNAIEVRDGSFILSGSQSEYYNSLSSAYLFKIDASGNYLMDNAFAITDTNTCFSIVFKLPNETNIINYENHKIVNNTSENFESIQFEKINPQDLSIIEKREYNIPINNSILPQDVLISDSNIFILSHYSYYNPTFQPLGTIVSKYNFNLDSLASFIDLRPSSYEAGIINNIEDHSIKSIFGAPGTLFISNLDYNLNLINSKDLNHFFSPSGCATPYSNSKYFLTGTVYDVMNISEHIKLFANNMNDEKIDSMSYYNNADSTLYAGFVTNTAIINNHIFVVGNYLFNPSQWPWQNTPTYIQITKMDTNLNVINHYFYGGDAVYTPYKILATSDGGALIIGMRYDQTNPSSHLCHPFALKVNSEGMVVTGIDEAFNSISHSAIVFPNPGKEVINLTSGIQLNNGVFTLFNLKGQPVITERINATEMQFNASNLASGTYIWQIELNHKIVEKGKWVKE